MKKSDAEKVLKIMATADRDCEVCAGGLMEKFVKEYPEHTELADAIYKNEFNKTRRFK